MGLTGLRVTRRQVRWARVVSLGMHLADIGSRSAFLVLDETRQRTFFDGERKLLSGSFPDGSVEESYLVDLLVAVRS